MGSVGSGRAGPGKWWVCREVFLGSLGSLVAPLGGRGQPISGRQSPEGPPGSGPETILLKEKFEAISTLKEPSRLVRSAEGLALWRGAEPQHSSPSLLLCPSHLRCWNSFSSSLFTHNLFHLLTTATLHVLPTTSFPLSTLVPSSLVFYGARPHSLPYSTSPTSFRRKGVTSVVQQGSSISLLPLSS